MDNTIFVEFPVSSNASIEDFFRVSLDWATQINNSILFKDSQNLRTSEDDEGLIQADGESLRFKKWIGEGHSAAGIRHERVDSDAGVVWSTECVMTLRPQGGSIALRGACRAQRDGAQTHTPKKPQLVRLLLDAGMGGMDGDLSVAREAHPLAVDEFDRHAGIREGRGNCVLPIILVSKGPQTPANGPLQYFASRLSGMAHVVTYPTVAFSKAVAEQPGLQTPRDGALALALPGKGIVRRYFVGSAMPDWPSVSAAVERDVIRYLDDFRPRDGLDWNELQERHATAMRRRLTDQGFDLYAAEFDAEIEAKDQRIAALNAELSELKAKARDAEYEKPALTTALERAEAGLHPLYDGELTDRLLRILKRPGTALGLSARDSEGLALLREAIPSSGNAARLKAEIKRSCKGGDSPESVLTRLGYVKSREKKHTVLTHPANMPSLQPITVHKTPSDHRAGKNLASQIINALDLRDL